MEIQKRGIPLVLLDKECNDVPVDCVVADNYSGMKRLTQYVIDQGHKNIAYLSLMPETSDTIVKRRLAFCDCMVANGIEINPAFLKTDFTNHTDCYKDADQFFRETPGITAAVCFNDSFAHVCYEVFKTRQIKIPEDISVCSFDGFERTASYTPMLTAMSQNIPEMAKAAVELLLRRTKMTGASDANVQIKHVVPTVFRQGGSVKKLT